MARNLESGVGELECSAAVIAARVLRADEFFEDIEMRALEARPQSVADIFWKLADLGDDPTQDVAREDHGRRFFKTRFFPPAPSAPAGKDTMCCEELGTFGTVIGDAELRYH